MGPEAHGEEPGANGTEHGARGMGQGGRKGEGSSVQRAQGTESEESRAVSDEKKPYRSKIMRGSMKNYFPRNRERIQKQSMIRFVVILIILAFVIYIYLRY